MSSEATEGGDDARAAIRRLRERAVASTVERLHHRFPALYRRFGEEGRKLCRDDIHFHLDFLEGAVVAGEPRLFCDYVAWLTQVLESRGIPVECVRASLELLRDFFSLELPRTHGALTQTLCAASALLDRRTKGEALPEEEEADGNTSQLAQLLVRGDRVGLREFMNACRGSCTYLDLAVSAFQPALYNVGVLWQQNQISVAQEHLATALVQSSLALAFAAADLDPPTPRRVICACVQKNEHALGLRVVADAFEIAGWELSHLGANVPLQDLLKLADATKPDVVALSVSTTFQLDIARKTIAGLRHELGSRRPTVLIGGLACNGFPELWRHLGADDWRADALGVYEYARS
jgi:methanogenic corrinoid protein MtbC1